jgi:hypothetical protein
MLFNESSRPIPNTTTGTELCSVLFVETCESLRRSNSSCVLVLSLSPTRSWLHLVRGYAVIPHSTVPKVLWYARCQQNQVPGTWYCIGRRTVQVCRHINWKLVTLDCSYTGVISTVKVTSYCGTPLAGLPVLPATLYSSSLYLVLEYSVPGTVVQGMFILHTSTCTCTRYWSTVLELMK